MHGRPGRGAVADGGRGRGRAAARASGARCAAAAVVPSPVTVHAAAAAAVDTVRRRAEQDLQRGAEGQHRQVRDLHRDEQQDPRGGGLQGGGLSDLLHRRPSACADPTCAAAANSAGTDASDADAANAASTADADTPRTAASDAADAARADAPRAAGDALWGCPEQDLQRGAEGKPPVVRDLHRDELQEPHGGRLHERHRDGLLQQPAPAATTATNPAANTDAPRPARSPDAANAADAGREVSPQTLLTTP